LEHEPEGHDLARCRWQHLDMKLWLYAILRRAYQLAPPSQQDELVKLARMADTGDAAAGENLRNYALEIVKAAQERSQAVRGGKS
jgi:hypothetical protein